MHVETCKSVAILKINNHIKNENTKVKQYYSNTITVIQKVHQNCKYLAIILPYNYLKHRKNIFLNELLNSKRLLERMKIGKTTLKMAEGKIYASQDFLTSAPNLFIRF